MPYSNPADRNRVRRRYAASPEGKTRRKEWLAIRKEKFVALKDVPCADCGGRFPPECMDFDHVRGEKELSMNVWWTSVGSEKFAKEVEKCDIVCANCHRIRTRKSRWPREGD